MAYKGLFMSDSTNIDVNEGLMSLMDKKYKNMSKGQKLLARYTMENYQKVAFMTASKLGETVGVSESTVVRFANALGFSGYPKFQDSLQELIKTKLTTVERVEMSNRDFTSNSQILENVLKTDIDNIKETLDTLDQEVNENSINLLLSAKKVYIMGLRSSIYVAKYLGYYLNYILKDVSIVRMDMGEPVEQLLKMGEGDILLVVSFPRYSKKTVQAVRFAKNRGANVIALTDSINAPVAKYADEVCTVKNNMVSFIDSLVPAFSLANALVIGVAMREKEDIVNYFNELESIWDKFEIYE